MPDQHILVKLGWEYYHAPRKEQVHFVDDAATNAMLNDLKHCPHAFVLACCMDRQMKAELAWMTPYRISRLFGDFSMKTLASKSEEEYVAVFMEQKLHRFSEIMGKVFHDAVQRIHVEYEDDAGKIWADRPSSAAVVRRFLEFNGVGVKIATMAANILACQCKIPFSDKCSIDVSPDVHVRRVMCRMGLVEKGAGIDEIIYKARELCPEFPGVIDFSLWRLGREICRADRPDCGHCPVASSCARRIG